MRICNYIGSYPRSCKPTCYQIPIADRIVRDTVSAFCAVLPSSMCQTVKFYLRHLQMKHLISSVGATCKITKHIMVRTSYMPGIPAAASGSRSMWINPLLYLINTDVLPKRFFIEGMKDPKLQDRAFGFVAQFNTGSLAA